MASKKMRSRSGVPVRVALTSGHVITIGSEWLVVDERFHSAAYSLGCVSSDMEVSRQVREAEDIGALDQMTKQAEQHSLVRTAIMKAIDGNNLKAFTKAGNPTAKYIREELGETIPNHVISQVMAGILSDGIEVPISNPNEELKSDITGTHN